MSDPYASAILPFGALQLASQLRPENSGIVTKGELTLGQTLGRYELLVPIAQGGMAVVWAARMRGTRGFQKIVAVKSMLPNLSEDAQFEQMFLAEAALASRIRHPNVCEILDLGEDEGNLYIVMEWIDGDSLSVLQKMARKQDVKLPIAVATRIIRDAALGLHSAHELTNDDGDALGLVHRDVSPQNILVTCDGRVKVVDFGVAKATGAGAGAETRAGQVKGKIAFMSPEQALGRPIDRRTDVFALGICLYQLITGSHPFRGDSDYMTMDRISNLEPVARASASSPSCPPALDAVIARALEKDVVQRYPTMLALAKALDSVLLEFSSVGDDGDIGAFTRSVLGARTEKRRVAIRESIRLADERLTGGGAPDQSGAYRAAPPDAPTAPGSRSAEVSHVSITDDANPSNSGITDLGQLAAGRVRSSTPNVALSNSSLVGDRALSSTGPRRRRVALAAALIGIVGVAITVAASMTGRKPAPGSDANAASVAASSKQASTAPPAAATTEAPVSAPAPTAAASVTAVMPASVPPASTAAGRRAAAATPKSAATATSAPTASKPRPNVPQVRDPGF